MNIRAVGIASVVIGALAVVCANPARAATVSINFEMSYFATIPGNPVSPNPPTIIPSNFVGTQLTGTPSFYLAGVDPMPPLFEFNALNVGQTFSTTFSFEPPDPCIAVAACQVRFSFGGLAGTYTANAYAQSVDLTTLGSIPNPPTIMPIGTTLDFLSPSPPTIRVAGLIVGFDDPEIVGEWAVTLNVDTTPLPAALPLFASGLGALGLLGWRRKRKAAALAELADPNFVPTR